MQLYPLPHKFLPFRSVKTVIWFEGNCWQSVRKHSSGFVNWYSILWSRMLSSICDSLSWLLRATQARTCRHGSLVLVSHRRICSWAYHSFICCLYCRRRKCVMNSSFQSWYALEGEALYTSWKEVFMTNYFSSEMKYLEPLLGCITFCHQRDRNVRGRSQVHSIAEHVHEYQKLGRTCRKSVQK
jgi:hypothetical protein